jgi:transcriptional regulator with XRE-family HTH domain
MAAEQFGDMLRRLRKAADKTLGEVARALGVSIVYVSDVERDKIMKVASILNTDPAPLVSAADQERGFIEYDLASATPLEAGVVSGLVAGLARGGITEDQLENIQAILDKKGATKL